MPHPVHQTDLFWTFYVFQCMARSRYTKCTCSEATVSPREVFYCELLLCLLQDVDLPEQVDVIVSEWMVSDDAVLLLR